MSVQNLQKRISQLEARRAPNSNDGWPPKDCDHRRRLQKYAACLDGRPWMCMGTPEGEWIERLVPRHRIQHLMELLTESD